MATDAPAQDVRRGGLRRALWAAMTLLAVAGCLPTLLAFGARWWWPLELFTHFRVQYAWYLLGCVVLLAAGRKIIRAGAVGLFLLYNGARRPQWGKKASA